MLSDPQKRSRYDQLGEPYTNWQQRGAPGGFNWDEWVTTHAVDVASMWVISVIFSAVGGGFLRVLSSILAECPIEALRHGRVPVEHKTSFLPIQARHFHSKKHTRVPAAVLKLMVNVWK